MGKGRSVVGSRRRLLIALGALPLSVRAQRKLRRVTRFSATDAAAWSVLRDSLEGVAVDVRSSEGRFGELDELAADIVRGRPDVIVAHETPAAAAAAKATQRIPIVMAGAWEPVKAANVTGVSVNTAQLAARVVDLIRELKSNARRIALLANADDPSNRAFLVTLNQAASRIRVPVGISRVRTAEDYETVFMQWERLRLQALIVHPSVEVKRTAQLTLRDKLPAIALARGFVEAGGLMSYSANPRALARQVGAYVERILKGARPGELPVEPLAEFELAVNLRTARLLEMELPDGVLGRADAVLQ